MNVALVQIADVVRKPWRDLRPLVEAAAAEDGRNVHRLVDRPNDADCIIGFDVGGNSTASVVWRKCLVDFPSRCFLFSQNDGGFPFLPGIYPSLTHHNYIRSRSRSGPYLDVIRADDLDDLARISSAPFLFGFFGHAGNSNVRQRIMELQHKRAVIADTSGANGYLSGQSSGVYREFREKFVEHLANCKFILCPRGVGSSSIRLFEAMRAGRVPVIISDDWVEPDGPAWSEFSVRIPESNVTHLPALLERLEPRADRMGSLAREAWNQFFSRQSIFHWLVEQCISISESRYLPEPLARRLILWRLACPRNLNRITRPLVGRQIRAYLAMARLIQPALNR